MSQAAIDIRSQAPAPTIDLDPRKLEFGRTMCPTWLSCAYDNGVWHQQVIGAMNDINLHPAAIVLHYGQAIFEGMKAYKWEDGTVRLFRPLENARRFNRSALRMAMPEFNENNFVEGIRQLVAQQRDWIPQQPGSLYIRPTMIATEPCIGVRAASQFLYYVITMPSGAYFSSTAAMQGVGSVRVFVTTKVGRASRGGTGAVKAAANYAITLQAITEGKKKNCSQVLFLDACGQGRVEEMGGMNIFFVSGKKLMTPRLTDTILPGVTRDSILKIAPSLGYEVEERELNFTQLLERIKTGDVSEVFACGTAAVVCGVNGFLLDSGEEVKIGEGVSGAATNALYDRLTGIQYGRYPDPFGWVESV